MSFECLSFSPFVCVHEQTLCVVCLFACASIDDPSVPLSVCPVCLSHVRSDPVPALELPSSNLAVYSGVMSYPGVRQFYSLNGAWAVNHGVRGGAYQDIFPEINKSILHSFICRIEFSEDDLNNEIFVLDLSHTKKKMINIYIYHF